MKKSLIIGRCLTESLTSNTAPLVCALLSVPLKEHNGELEYLLPVILYYACMKAGIYLLNGAVHIENPYRLMKYCIYTAFTGSFFLLNGDSSSSSYLAGAIITGIGLSPFSSLYKLISDKEEIICDKPFLRKFASSVLTLLIGVFCLISKVMGSRIILCFWCVYLGVICVYITFLPEREKFSTEKLLVFKNKWLIHCFPALLLFVMMAAVSGYKQSGNGAVFALMLISLILLIIWNRTFEDRRLHMYCAQTMWLGAIRGFELMFALIYLADTNQSSLTNALYVVIVAAGFFAPALEAKFRKIDTDRVVWICMSAALVSMFLLVSRNVVLLLLGIFICVSFTETGKSHNLNVYRDDRTAIPDEYRLRQDKMFSLGNGMMQAFTMVILYIISRLISGHGNTLMQTYVFRLEAENNRAVLLIGSIFCIIYLFVWLISIAKMPENKNRR